MGTGTGVEAGTGRTRKTRAERGKRAWSHARGAAMRCAGTLALLAAWALLPAGLLAQRGDTLKCAQQERVGSIGITGMVCDRCEFSTDGRAPRAVFWTEPTITDLNPELAGAAVLEPGDVLVAVDGQLITTNEGSARFSHLPTRGSVSLRIRRNGRLRDISVPLTPVCPAAGAARAPRLTGRPLPPTPPSPASSPSPISAPSPLTQPAPPPPPPDRILPRAELGFAFTCTGCSYISDAGGRWRFPEPPVVSGVSAGVGQAGSGLREGDRILKVDGKEITKPEGARAFGGIRPGDHPRWTVERDGQEVTVVTVAHKRVVEDKQAVPTRGTGPTRAPLRYSGSVGDALVEVRGGKVSVMETPRDGLLVIRTGDAEIRIRVPRKGASGGR